MYAIIESPLNSNGVYTEMAQFIVTPSGEVVFSPKNYKKQRFQEYRSSGRSTY